MKIPAAHVLAALFAIQLLLTGCRAPQPTHDEPTEVPCSTPGVPPVPDSARRPPPPPDPIPQKPSPRDGEPVRAPDLHHVDVVDLVEQAREIARRYDQQAALVSIRVRDGVVGGLVDLTGAHAVHLEFAWLYYDKTKAPGRDKTEGRVWLIARGGRFTAQQLGGAHELWNHGAAGPDPRCSARAAWTAAVRAGLPENAAVSMRYGAHFPGGPGKRYVWTLGVDGHQEMERVVDGATCAVEGHAPRRR